MTQDEANLILEPFIKARDNYNNNNSESNYIKYKKELDKCTNEFTYLVLNYASKYKGFSNYNDLVHDGIIALIMGLNSFKAGKGSWFFWAKRYIKTKLAREANKHSTIKIPMTKAKEMTPYKVKDVPEQSHNRQEVDSVFDTYNKKENVRHIKVALSKLPLIEREIVEMHFELGRKSDKSISKICANLGIDRKDCLKHLSRAKKTLKKELNCLMV